MSPYLLMRGVERGCTCTDTKRGEGVLSRKLGVPSHRDPPVWVSGGEGGMRKGVSGFSQAELLPNRLPTAWNQQR